MAKTDILDSYEDLVTYIKEVRSSMDILHDWLKRDIDWDSQCDLYDFIVQHSSQFAVLNLIMYRLDELTKEHQDIIEKAIKGYKT